MSIGIGDQLPRATFKRLTANGVEDVPSADVFGNRTVVLFAVPGAFTPTCSNSHLPEYVRSVGEFAARGVDSIACVAVNDPFVMAAWGKAHDVDDKILLLSDGNATFTKAIGLEFDASARGLGTRSRRYAMLVENGVVKALRIEEVPGQVAVSGASDMLALL